MVEQPLTPAVGRRTSGATLLQCPQCQFENRGGVRFCENCGTKLALTCPSCGALIPPDRNFCGECGASLSLVATARHVQPAATDHITPDKTALEHEAERRQLTVMFCDLVGSTALSTKLDPEDMREVITSFQDKCRQAIRQYGGFIARYMGDGMLVYFGYPQAHEDDAERAVRAGLAIVRSMAELNVEIGKRYEVVLAVRVGVATGLVVVGDIVGEGAAEEAAVVGETPNLAARLQGVAEPNQVVVASVTHQLLGALFEHEDLGKHELKGITQPVQVWRVTAEREVESRYEAKRVGARLPLVGRQEELGLLVRSWEAAKEGHGQVVLIQGEGGIGKSRLVGALRERVAGDDYIWVAVRCSPYHANSTLYPVIEQVKRAMGWKPEDDAETRVKKLEGALRKQSLPLEEVVPLYAELMSLPLPKDRYPALQMTPQQKREATLDAVVGWLLELAERRPMLNVWEDLHWADPTTLELLKLYIEQSPTVSILNVLTYRPEFVPPWSMHSHMTPITLNRLERAEVEAIVKNLAGGKSVPAEVLEHIVSKADGVPLYVEELTKAILDSKLLEEQANRYVLSGSLADMQIPSTLQDSLMARLDRLPTVREVAQLGAVLGREFAYEMLQSLAPLEEPVLQNGLGQLVENELLYQRGRGHRARYVFKHALIQDAAYHSLLKRSRQEYHRQVAELMKKKLPETARVQPEILAHHYSEAGCHQEAVEYWHAAGRIAAQRSANVEAILHLKRGLVDLSALPETPERARTELQIQTTLGPALIATMGYGAEAVHETYARAQALCAQVGSKSDAFPVSRGLWNSYLFRAEMLKAREHGEELLHLAEQIGDDALIVEAHRVVATVSFFMGDFLTARKHAEAGIDVYDPERHRELAFVYGADPQVVCELYGALSQWMLGYPDGAWSAMNKAVTRARELSLAHTEAFALVYQAMLYQFNRQPDLARKSAEAGLKVASEHRIQQWSAWGTICHGWAEFMAADKDRGMNQLRQGLKEWYEMGQREFAVPYFLALTAEALATQGQVVEAYRTTTDALQITSKTAQAFFAAELHRLRGVFLLEMGESNKAEAEKSLRQSLDDARQRKAKSFELRAAVNLARLWQQLGKVEEAREMLSEIYGWFTEGFDTVDLKEAKALVEELA
jgi:class 3 adenylate cyclase/predicted ATPase